METVARPGSYRPTYENDEVALGVALALALHALPVVLVLLHVLLPVAPDNDVPLVGKPVVSATLLKLGKPMDPKKLPDRLVPRARTAPIKETVASQEDPLKNTPKPDAGPPPPTDVKDDAITRLINHSDPFAEDAGKDRPEEGHAEGIEGGTETDPNKVHAGDMYAAKLGAFFHERWQYPTVITQGDANRLCMTFQITIDRNMVIWHMRTDPVKSSGNDLFDDSARTMFQKLLDDRTPLPEPPPEVAEMYRGRAVNIALSGALHGDTQCK
jgi:hypothetical protein